MNKWTRALAPSLALTTLVAAMLVASMHADAVMWTAPLGHGLAGVAVLDAGAGRLIVSSDDDAAISILVARDGRLLRTIHTGAPLLSAPQAIAIDARTQRTFVTSGNQASGVSRVWVLETRDGIMARTVRVGSGANALAVDTRAGHVFVTSGQAHSVNMLDAASGALLRIIHLDAAPQAVCVDEQTARAFVTGTSTEPPGYSVALGTISVLDTHSGAVLRTVPVGDNPGTPVVDTRLGRVFVAGQAGASIVAMLDARSGALMRLIPVGGVPTALAVDARYGHLFVLSAGDNTLTMLDAASGHVLRTVGVGDNASALAVDERGSRLFVAAWGTVAAPGYPTGAGSVSVFNLRSGALWRTIRVGVAPQNIVVDAYSGHAYVVNQGGLVAWADPWTELARRVLPWLPALAHPTQWAPASVSLLA